MVKISPAAHKAERQLVYFKGSTEENSFKGAVIECEAPMPVSYKQLATFYDYASECKEAHEKK